MHKENNKGKKNRSKIALNMLKTRDIRIIIPSI